MFLWDEAADACLKQMWKAGCSAAEIGVKLNNPSRNSVIGRAHRLGMKHPARFGKKVVERQRNGTNTIWTPELMAEFHRLVGERLMATQIAIALSELTGTLITQAAVTNKAHRDNIAINGRVSTKAEKRVKAKPSEPKPKAKRSPVPTPPVFEFVLPENLPPQPETSVDFLSHRIGFECAAILDQRGEYGLPMMCGSPVTSAGGSWCAYHHARYFPRGKALKEEIKRMNAAASYRHRVGECVVLEGAA